nr:hypothetical protein [Tanacetum cinerariifolium]
MHKAFPLLVRKFPLPEGTSHCLKKNATAKRKVLPLPEVCTAIIVKEKPSTKIQFRSIFVISHIITFQRLLSVLIILEDPDLSFQQVQDMDQQYPTVAKIPMLDTEKFEQWQFRMQQYLQHEHYALWEKFRRNQSQTLRTWPLSLQLYTAGEMMKLTLLVLTLLVVMFLLLVQMLPLLASAKKLHVPTLLLNSTSSERRQRRRLAFKDQMLQGLINQKLNASTVTRWDISQENPKLPETRRDEGETPTDREDHALVTEAPTEFALMADTSIEKKAYLATKDLDNLIESQRSDKSKEGLRYTAIPPPVAQLYLSLKKDLSWTGLPECVDDTVTDYSRSSPTVESSSKEDQNKNPSASENVASPITPKQFVKFVKANDSQFKSSTKGPTADIRMKGKAVKSSACWSWKPLHNLSNKGPKNNSVSVVFKKYACIDTQGRLKHMTGNISYLSDFEPFDGGCVSFRQGGCKITGKGTIKTECIVLGRDFKLLDDANILLRTPRQHNMYSIDLNNIVPHRDLTCLVAKASADECNLWHRRL